MTHDDMPEEGSPWQQLERTHVYEKYGRGIDEVTYLLPSGQDGLFTIQTQRPSVGVLALTSDNRVILTYQFRPGPMNFVYELPGGYLDTNEDPVVAGLRELQEETGYTSKYAMHGGSCYVDSYSTGRKHCVVAKNCTSTDVRSLDDTEFIDVRIVSLQELRRLLTTGQFIDVDVAFLGLTAAGVLQL
jgi:ADP-ribose pyrophosphatase